MEPIIITAAPAGRGRYHASVNGRYLCTTKSPLLDGARVLAVQGADPARPIGLMHAGSDQIVMRSSIGVAAGLVIEEGDRLALRKYRPPSAVERVPAADHGPEAPDAHQDEDALL